MRIRAGWTLLTAALCLRPAFAAEIPKVELNLPSASAQVPVTAAVPGAVLAAPAAARASQTAAQAPAAALPEAAAPAAQAAAPTSESSKAAADAFWERGPIRRSLLRAFRSVRPEPAPRIGASEMLARLNAEERAGWAERVAIGPEVTVGLTAEQAVAKLEMLRGRKNLLFGARHVRNETYFVRIDGHLGSVVKKTATRSDFSFEGRVTHVRNDADLEPFSFRLDRYLGSNIVPPGISLAPGLSAQVRIVANDYPLNKAMADPKLYLDLCHTRLLDFLMVNYDRSFPGNLERHVDNLFAIDFDLSKLNPALHSADTIRYFVNDRIRLRTGERLKKGEILPPVFLRGVVEKLRSLDGPTLDAIAAEAGVSVSREKKEGLLLSARQVLAMIDQLVARYGEKAILVD